MLSHGDLLTRWTTWHHALLQVWQQHWSLEPRPLDSQAFGLPGLWTPRPVLCLSTARDHSSLILMGSGGTDHLLDRVGSGLLLISYLTWETKLSSFLDAGWSSPCSLPQYYVPLLTGTICFKSVSTHETPWLPAAH